MTSSRRRADVYVSCDVETDGPIPGPFSMLSFGMAVAGSFDGSAFLRADPAADTFYAELRPISDDFEPDRVAATGLDRDALREHGRDPSEAIEEAAAWVRSLAGDRRPVFVGYPAVFDWMWMHWYFERFTAAGSPFGFSSALDMKTLYAVKASVPVSEAVKRRMPRDLLPRSPHTHHARDDAIEQAELFANLFEWRR